MTVEKILSFWDQHNTAIIEGLVALIVLISLFLAYRAFFAKKDKGGGELGNGSLDAAQLEKTLQKILDNQQTSTKSSRSAAASEDFGVDAEMDESPAGAPSAASMSSADSEAVKESAAEVAQLRLSLNESYQKIAELQAQLQEAQAAAQAGGGESSAPVAAEGGLSAAEKEELNGKLRDLEARLAEYEIISEDIADLSRYRDENEDLKKQLEALKAGGAAAAPAASQPEVAAAAEPAPAPAAEPTPEPVAEPAVEAAPAEVGSDLIDDDLMKEFAAAVEGQRALDKAAEKAGDGKDEAAKSGDETNQLMDEFENFVSKKS